MTSFRYTAVATNGASVSGAIDAPSAGQAIEDVRKLGHYPISATPAARERWRALVDRARRPAGPAPMRELAVLTQELATLLEAGLELDRALEVLADLRETRHLRAPLLAVTDKIKRGTSLADALAEQAAFPKLYAGMIRAGESSGDLVPVLRRLADYLLRANAIRDAVLSALLYPAILLAASVASVLFILIFVLPQFQALFAESGKALPLATRIVISIGDFVRTSWWLLLLLGSGSVFAARFALEKPKTRDWLDTNVLKIPVLGDLILKIETERLCRTLSALLSNGVALPSTLAIVADTLSNRQLTAAVRSGAIGLREGDGLSSLLARADLFPPMLIDLVRVGERASKLAEMLLHQADLYERNIRHTTDRLLALLVPGLTVMLGILVAGLVGSILSAVMSVNELAAP